jgi:hypothetical protein
MKLNFHIDNVMIKNFNIEKHMCFFFFNHLHYYLLSVLQNVYEMQMDLSNKKINRKTQHTFR